MADASINTSDAPDSWEVADLDESLRKLKLSLSTNTTKNDAASTFSSSDDSSSAAPASSSASTSSDDALSQVDQFLKEALQNPRERLSVLRIEQGVEKFIRDPKQQQLEFRNLPTSYLRLAAHRVAQHYSLQSMVLLDDSLPDGSGSIIIVTKGSDCRLPKVRLVDIPLSTPSDGGGLVKVAIKQRPQRRTQGSNSGNPDSLKSNNSKTVEERNEEYTRARARIFSSISSAAGVVREQEKETKVRENIQPASVGISKVQDKSVKGGNAVSLSRSASDTSAGSSRSYRANEETETSARTRPNNRVAIFRDRDIECRDPDYDRSYDRYVQRFDPGFGFNGGPYPIQPMYVPAVNYNSEFPQLGAVHRPHMPFEHQARPLPHHLPGQWSAAGVGYGHGPPEAMMAAFGPNHLTRSPSAIYPYAPHYICQRPGMPFMHPQEHVQPYTPSHQQPDGSYGYARPR